MSTTDPNAPLHPTDLAAMAREYLDLGRSPTKAPRRRTTTRRVGASSRP